MKKTKFAVLLTAFMAVLGLSSCLGEPDPYDYGTAYLKVVPSGYGYSFMTYNDILLTPNEQSFGVDLMSADYAWVSYKYERETTDLSSKKVNIILQYSPVAIKKLQDYGSTEEANSYIDYVGLSQYAFPFYGSSTIFLDLSYKIKNVSQDDLKDELANHSLDIVRVESQCTPDRVVLKINHNELDSDGEEHDEKKVNYNDIRYVDLDSFLWGETPEKLVLKFNKYNNVNEEIKEDSCVINYKDIVDTYFSSNTGL